MKTALITGANKGIGLEFVRQLKENNYYVIGCCRNPSTAKELYQLADEVMQLDVTNDQQINALVEQLNQRPIDLLVNNAGIRGEIGVTVGNLQRKNFIDVFQVNCVSVLKVTEALLPNIQKSEEQCILVISSQMGSISDNSSGGSYAYRASKAALNCVMRSFALDVRDKGVHVMLIHPGWVKTDMGGSDALIDVRTSVSGMLAQVKEHSVTSHADKLYRFDGRIIGW